MAWTDYHSNLRDVLAGLFYTTDDARRVVMDSGIPQAQVTWVPKPVNLWQNIVEEADRRGKLTDLIDAVLKQYPDNPHLLEAKNGPVSPTPARGPDIESDIQWSGPTDEQTLEKIIGPENNLLPVAFLALGAERANAVCRIVRHDNKVGTGFLVAEDILVTNHHVLPDADKAKNSRAQFNYQRSIEGLDEPPEAFQFELGNDGFWTDKQKDLTAVRVAGAPGNKYGIIGVGEAPLKVKDRVSIIQHPGGLDKQVALHNNTVVYIDNKVVQYLTDTMPGSSGSPVFDRDWRLAAVHHSGGWLREPRSKQRYFRNEGIPVALLKQGLSGSGLLSPKIPDVRHHKIGKRKG